MDPHSFSYPLNSLDKEFETFNYKLLWQHFFHNKAPVKQEAKIPPSKLTNNRVKHKPPQNVNITKYTVNLKKQFITLIKNIPKIGISIETKNFYKTIHFFKTSPKFVLKPADKGSSIIIMHQDFYLNLGLDFINSNLSFFKTLDTDPLLDFTNKINLILNHLLNRNKISAKLKQIIKPSTEPKTPNLYFLPKIHKFPRISGRPICSANAHPAENISIFLDYTLKPYATMDPIYLKDGPQLLDSLQNISEIPPHALLFSIDVVNMYTNIPLPELTDVIQKIITNNPQILSQSKFPVKPDIIHILLKLVLYTNYFKFNDQLYHQVHGLAMGTPCACTISDLFICDFVKKHFFNWTYKPRLYKQYRDDSFGLWLHGENTLLQYLDHLNSLHPTIKFTLAFGKSIQFLDLSISLTSWGTISTETYYKPTDTFQYLEANSNHPPSVIKNIPKSQILRHIRNCSNPSSLLAHSSILAHNLIKRNYKKNLIKSKYISILNSKRSTVLQQQEKSRLKRTPLIITYNSNLPNLSKITTNNLPSQLLKTPPLLAYRIKPTLGKYIMRAKFRVH